jgi:hypothetical protein
MRLGTQGVTVQDLACSFYEGTEFWIVLGVSSVFVIPDFWEGASLDFATRLGAFDQAVAVFGCQLGSWDEVQVYQSRQSWASNEGSSKSELTV